MIRTERHLEEHLLGKLQELKYVYRPEINDKASLEANFRAKFQALNRVNLSDAEFSRLLEEIISSDVFASAKRLREKNTFFREDGTPLNYNLVNVEDWCKNDFEVINQLRINTDNSFHRYDAIILINGIPVVQVELKTLGINPKKAMEQIVDYKNDPGNGYAKSLLCFLQLFIVSNRDQTYYFANNNARHFSFDADERYLPVYQYADIDNRKITHLDDFAETFLSKCVLGQMISRYMVLIQSEQKLLVMRPYQIYAVQAIVQCIEENSGNGYIWHTTGSGKTLTSFKASTLLKANENISKVLFVVDRKDLDRQTREEFNRFQPGCVEENTNTASLVRRLLSEDLKDKVIVTTIQKLGLALDEASKRNTQRVQRGQESYTALLEPLRDQRMVIIFDECHRSQFGDSHQAIKEFFPKAQLFGFTGTPIFEKNATVTQVEGNVKTLMTTADIFQKELHAYTITHAIDDGNVLRFHVDYYNAQGKDKPKPGDSVAKRAVLDSILDKHEAATGGRRFNALFATASINDAIEYWVLFDFLQKERQLANPEYRPLNVACVFSPPGDVSPDAKQLQEDLPQEREDNKLNPEEKKEALRGIIADYNARYKTNFRLEEFDLYYQDIQQRIKNQQYPNADLPHTEKIDITIVVDMLLTGFDSKFLNTLYVDKNLKHHGLIQAFSRTNRILNATKPYGTILDFRGQEAQVDEAIGMFSGGKFDQAKTIWLVAKAPVVIESLTKAVGELDAFMESQGLATKPEQVANLRGDAARVAFVEKFKAVQALATQLDQYTDLTNEQKETVEKLLPEDQLRGFKGAYLTTVQRLRDKTKPTGGQAPDPVVAELDFQLVLFASALIDYDYILGLIAKYSQQKPGKRKIRLDQLIAMIAADSQFLDERDLITEYVKSLEVGVGLNEDEVRAGYQAFKAERDAREVLELAQRHGLPVADLNGFVEDVLQRRIFDGERLTPLMEPLGLGWKARTERELALMEDLEPLLKRRAGHREIAGLKVYESVKGYDVDGE